MDRHAYSHFGFLLTVTLTAVLLPAVMFYIHTFGLDRHSSGVFVRIASPHTLHQRDESDDLVPEVFVDSSGRWYLDSKPLAQAQLKAELKTLLVRRANRDVFFYADEDADCSVAFEAIAAIRSTYDANPVLLIHEKSRPSLRLR